MQCCDHGAPAPITMLQSPSEYGMVAPPTKGSYVTVEVQLHWRAPDFYFFPFFSKHVPLLLSTFTDQCQTLFFAQFPLPWAIPVFSHPLVSMHLFLLAKFASLKVKIRTKRKEKKKSIYHVNTKRFFFLFCVNKSEKKFDKNAFHNSLGPASKLLLKMVFLL